MRLVRVLFFVCLACLTLGLGVGSGLYYIVSQKTPSIEEIRSYEPPAATEIFADNGEPIGGFGAEQRFPVTLEEMPKPFKDAAVAACCRNFFTHGEPGIGAALESALHIVRGNLPIRAVPVCHSFFRGAWPYYRPLRTLVDKLSERLLLRNIENGFSREEILCRFLNRVYLGGGAYGVEAAARTYFGRHAKDLTTAECATIAGVIICPSSCSPTRDKERALKRRNQVLRRMYDDGYISRQQYDNAIREELTVVEGNDKYDRAPKPFLEAMGRYLGTKYGTDLLYKGGLQVYTSVHIPSAEDVWDTSRPPEDYITKVLDRHGKVLEEHRP